MNEKNDKNQREIKKIAMNILKNQRKFSLAAIIVATAARRLADGARGRVSPESFVIRAAIVVAGKSKSGRRPENQKCGRKRQPIGNPARFRTEQRVRRIPKQLRANKTAKDNCRNDNARPETPPTSNKRQKPTKPKKPSPDTPTTRLCASFVQTSVLSEDLPKP